MVQLTPSEIRTLMVIYNLNTDGPVGPTAVARERGISRVSALEIIRSLVNKGLGVYVRGMGIELNDVGRKLARYYIWKHRTVETFLYREFSLAKKDACIKAMDIDINLDDTIAMEMYKKMGCPSCCPCGYEIPDDVGVMVYDKADI